jgi:hypothetical protein
VLGQSWYLAQVPSLTAQATGIGVLVLGITKWGGYIIAVGTLFILVGLLGIIVAYRESKQLAKVVS